MTDAFVTLSNRQNRMEPQFHRKIVPVPGERCGLPSYLLNNYIVKGEKQRRGRGPLRPPKPLNQRPSVPWTLSRGNSLNRRKNRVPLLLFCRPACFRGNRQREPSDSEQARSAGYPLPGGASHRLIPLRLLDTIVRCTRRSFNKKRKKSVRTIFLFHFCRSIYL